MSAPCTFLLRLYGILLTLRLVKALQTQSQLHGCLRPSLIAFYACQAAQILSYKQQHIRVGVASLLCAKPPSLREFPMSEIKISACNSNDSNLWPALIASCACWAADAPQIWAGPGAHPDRKRLLQAARPHSDTLWIRALDHCSSLCAARSLCINLCIILASG